MKNLTNKSIAVLTMLFVWAATVLAQTTAFNYQGRLTDAGNPANGNYQMQFKLFDALVGGTQIGGTISDVAAIASNGIFSVKLDFGANALDGANRWLEKGFRALALLIITGLMCSLFTQMQVDMWCLIFT